MVAIVKNYKPVPPKTFTPVGNKLAVHVFEAPENMGLVMPDGHQADLELIRARVIAVGPDVKQIKEGDLVLTGDRVPVQQVRYMGHRYHLLPENLVFAVVDKEHEQER